MTRTILIVWRPASLGTTQPQVYGTWTSELAATEWALSPEGEKVIGRDGWAAFPVNEVANG